MKEKTFYTHKDYGLMYCSDICDCEKCQKRGYLEPCLESLELEEVSVYITNKKSEDNFFEIDENVAKSIINYRLNEVKLKARNLQRYIETLEKFI